MPNCTQITDSNGNTRDICDQYARDSISQRVRNELFIGDLDDLTTTTVCYCGNAATNTPDGGGGLLIVSGISTTSMQLFAKNAPSPTVFARSRVNGAWRAWTQV